jgi:hypothetical protein
MKKSIELYFFLLLLPKILFSTNTGLDFLNIPFVPKIVSMGNSGVSITDDVYAININPAGLSSVSSEQLSTVYNSLYEEIYQFWTGFCYPTKKYSLGLSINYLGMSEFQGYNAVGGKEDYVTASDSVISFTYSRYISKNKNKNFLSSGITGKYITEILDNIQSSVLACDIGFLYKTKFINYALVIQNLGDTIKFDEVPFELPKRCIFSINYNPKKLNLVMDIIYSPDLNPYLNLGIEYNINNLLFLRSGYTKIGINMNDYLESPFSCGFGIKLNKISRNIFDELKLDYSFSEINMLNYYTHRIGLVLTFHRFTEKQLTVKEINRHMKSGTDYFNNKEYNKALLEFIKILQIDSYNLNAIDMIRKCKEKIQKIN